MAYWKVSIITPSNYQQNVFLEAATSNDAKIAAESRTGGKANHVNPLSKEVYFRDIGKK